MKRKFALIALVLASATGAANAGTRLAGDISIETTPFVSNKVRAEVRNEVVASLDEIAAMHGEDSGSSRLRFESQLNQEVVADYIANRAAVAAMHGEDSGSALLASITPPATVWFHLAAH